MGTREEAIKSASSEGKATNFGDAPCRESTTNIGSMSIPPTPRYVTRSICWRRALLLSQCLDGYEEITEAETRE